MSQGWLGDAGRRLTHLAGLVCAVCVCVFAGEARALLYQEVEISGCPGSGCTDPAFTFSHGGTSGEYAESLEQLPLEITDTKTDPLNGSTITATAIVGYTGLRAYAFASKPDGPYCPTASVCLADQARATARAQYWDEITVVGAPGTPNGTLVDVDFRNVLSGFTVPTPAYSGSSAYLITYVGRSPGLIDLQIVSQAFRTGSFTNTGSITVPVGSTLYVNASLTAEALARTDFPGSANEFIVNFLNTGIVYADARAPGFSLVAKSGHDYSSSVPEPSALLLLGLGVVTGRASLARAFARRS